MNPWDLVATIYGSVAVVTLLPVALPLLRGAKRFQGTVTIFCPHHFSEAALRKLNAYHSTILSELRSWRQRAAIYKRFHYYCVYWPIISSSLIPFVGGLASAEAKWLIVVASGHAALALSFYSALKVGDNMRAFRFGEPEFLDLNRDLVHRPDRLGGTENEQLTAYIEATEDIRKKVRAAENLGLANVETGGNRRV